MQSSARRERRTDRNPIPPDAVSGRPAGQIKRRIHGLTALADLEMDAAIRAFGAPGQGLTLPYAVALLHQRRAQTGVGGHPPALVADQDQISKPRQIVASIGDLPPG